MGMMAFFPWITVETPLTFGEFNIYPHTVGRHSQHGVPAVIDNIIHHYRETPTTPVRNISVLKLTEKPFGDDFTETERAKIFDFAEMLAAAGLSKRLFYQQFGGNYTNKDTIAVTVQGYREADGGVAVRSRLRYGSTLGYYTDDAYLVLCPPHVKANRVAQLDEALVNGLLAAKSSDDYSRFESSVYSFNRANTDNDLSPEQVEIIHQNGAFEALFNLGKGNEVKLSTAFRNCFIAHPESERNPSNREESRFPNATSSRDSWIRDLFRTRGSVAHGRARARNPAVWSMKEHLMLGSYIFPICLKLELERRGFYTLSENDRRNIFTFDRFLRSENLDAKILEGGEDENDPHANYIRDWVKIEREAIRELQRRRAISAFIRGN